MILLDTDVVSTLMKLNLDPVLARWLVGQTQDQLFTSATTVFEIRAGIELKPHDRRRQTLEHALEHVVTTTLGNRVAPFDLKSAQAAGRMRARQMSSGRNVSVADSQIAGIAATLGAQLATRNTRDFSKLGLHLINPWHPLP
jgi:toxin FitB